MRCALKGVMLFFVCLMAQGILLADEEQDQDRALTQEICRMLAEGHVTRRAPDDVISRRAWTNLLERYDLDRMVFLPEDIAAFEHVADKLDNAFRKGDFAFMFHLDGIYRERLRERTVFVTNALARTTFDFDGNDTYRIRGKTSQWLPAGAERDAVWMARLKGEVLDEWLSCETGGVAKAVAAVAKSYTDALDDERKRDPAGLRSAFIADIVSAYDAHTLYLPPDLYEMFRSEMDLSLCGVGAEWRLKDGAAKIRRVIPGGPMAKDGRIHVGDWITGVAPDNGAKIERLEGMGEEEIVALFRGEKGTKLTLEVKHADGRRGVYTLTRDEVAMEDMAASSRVVEVDIDGARRKVGYLRLASFYASELQKSARRSCFEDLRVELRKLREADVAGVLFDLRENGGGSLDDAVKVIGLFVRNGPAVRMSGLGGASTLPVPEGTVECEVPLLVLTSRSSASAGELVPATLQDLGRAVIAGDARTFGKGSAQTVCEFDDEEEGALIITDGRFYRVTGGSTQFKGVASDILLPSFSDSDEYEGERGLNYPLPWDSIPGVPFTPSWDLGKFVPQLRAASEARLARDPAWVDHLERVRYAEERAAAVERPLNREKRKAQLARDLAIEEALDRLDLEGYDPTKKGIDPVLEEGMRILADLVRLNGGRKLPAVATPAAETAVLFDSLDDD